MIETTICIPLTLFRQLPETVQAKILREIPAAKTLSETDRDGSDKETEGPIDLSLSQTREVIAGLKEKSLSVLRAVASSTSTEIQLADIIDSVAGASHNGDLRGPFSGITRRIRNVTGIEDADLIWWNDDPLYDHAGELIDLSGKLNPTTHVNLRRILLK